MDAPNVYVNDEYGPFTVDIALNSCKLDYNESLDAIQDSLKRLKKAKTFVFYTSMPGEPSVANIEKVINVNGVEYYTLNGMIKPCHTSHGALLGYDCSFFAKKKSGPIKVKETPLPAGKGLSPLAQRQLNLEIGDHLIQTALRSRDFTVERAIDKYLNSFHKTVSNTRQIREKQFLLAKEQYKSHVTLLGQVESIIEMARKSHSLGKNLSPCGLGKV